MIQVVLAIAILVLAVPAGLLIAWLARDELISGRKWFGILCVLGMIGLGAFIVLKLKELMFTFGFMIIVSGVAYWKSFNKKWAVKRIL